MEGEVIDIFQEKSGRCYLSKIALKDYVTGLPENYKDYDVQREIVKNTYLDDLITTVLDKNHIPHIVLIVDDGDYSVRKNKITVSYFKILDGLQRTYRLKTILDTLYLFKKEIDNSKNIFDLTRLDISKQYKDRLEKINSNSSILYKIIEHFKNLKDIIKEYESILAISHWFEVWTGLTPEAEVTKMLILNAGHKPVKTKHQIELLFINIIPVVKKINFPEFTLLREKEVTSLKFSKDRSLGEFHFSTLITSILSLSQGKPLTSNVDLIQKTQGDYFEDSIFEEFLSFKFLKQFIDTILSIDKSLSDEYKKDRIGLRWMGRETSLVGMFAAAGRLVTEKNLTPSTAILMLKTTILKKPSLLALYEFEKERNSLDLAKINIGNINKKAVYNGIYEILQGKSNKINWSNYFKGNA